MAVTLVDAEMATWTPDTRHYVTDDGVHLSVTVDAGVTERTRINIDEALAATGLPTLESGVHKIVVSPTTIIACTPEGWAADLTPLYTFPPGTSHEDALALAGFS